MDTNKIADARTDDALLAPVARLRRRSVASLLLWAFDCKRG